MISSARNLFEDGLKLSAEVGNETDVARYLEGLAAVAASEDRIVRAARLWGAEEALLEKIEVGVHTYVLDRYLHQSQIVAARVRLGEEAFAAAWVEGRKFTSEQAIGYALDHSAAPESATPETYPASLSVREAEVPRLVATGLTNAEAAGKLFVSPRTVDWHLSSIYRKLGSHSRAAATRFAIEHGLL